MLLYDHDRTEKIVEKLRGAVAVIRTAALATSTALFTPVGIYVGTMAEQADWLRAERGFLIGAVVGVIVGLIIGSYVVGLLLMFVEWMCQALIALGELIQLGRHGGS